MPSAAPVSIARRGGREAAVIACFLAVDAAALVAGFLAAFWLRRELLPELFALAGVSLQPFDWTLSRYFRLAPAALLWPAAFASEGLYRARRVFWEETRHVLRATIIAFVAILLTAFAFRVKDELSRPLAILTFTLAGLFALALRRALRRLLTGGGWYRRPVLIVAAAGPARRLLLLLRRERALGWIPVAVMPPLDDADAPAGLPLETPGAEALARAGALDLFVATAGLPAERLAALLEESAGVAQQVRMVPDLAGLPLSGLEAENLGELPILNVPQNLIAPASVLLKRGFDLAVAASTLPLLVPLLGLLWLWIRLDSPGPVLLRQPRLARGGGTFRCLKFRTMHEDADARLEAHLKARPEARAEWEAYQKLKGDDPRVTRAGRILRKLSLDELPQIFNILSGDMSMVGPRPYLPREIETMGRHAPVIVRARPGITGLWQVSGRNELTFAERLQLDEWYVRNWSLWLDITLLLRTPRALVARGAY